jgi:hypothetical protein
VDFPKGHFKLVFSYRDVSAPQEPAPSGFRERRTALASWLALTLILAGLCAYWGTLVFHLEQGQRASAAAAAWPPAVEEFWGPFLGSKDLTLICVGAPLFLRLPNSGFFRDSEVNSWDTAESLDLKRKLKRAFPGETPEPWYFYTGTGEAGGAFLIGNFLTARGFHLDFADSSQVTWNEIGEHSVVFVGPPKFVPQIEQLPITRDLIFDSLGIRNLKPKPGEPEFLRDAYTDREHQDSQSYGLISRLPGLHGKGEILVLGGTWTAGTLAASQYVTLENSLRELVAHVRLPSGKLPPYFQAVISATVKRGTPVESTYVFHHVLQATGGRDR